MSRQDPIRPKPASRTAFSGPPTGSPASTPKRATIWSAPSPCSGPGGDDDLAFRFGQDAGVAATLYLALALWPLGDVERAISLTRDAQERTARLAHVGTRAYEKAHAALFELMRGELSRSGLSALELARLSREHDLPMWRAYAVFLAGAGAESGAPGGGLKEMRRGAELLREQSILNYDGLLKIALAEAETRQTRSGDSDSATSTLFLSYPPTPSQRARQSPSSSVSQRHFAAPPAMPLARQPLIQAELTRIAALIFSQVEKGRAARRAT